MSVKIITKKGKLSYSEILEVSEIHYQTMRGAFSKLGMEFIKKYYISVNKNGLFYCKKKKGKIVAYTCWVYDSSKVSSFFLKSNFFFLIFFFLRNIFTYKIIVLIKLLLFMIIRSSINLPKAEWVAIAKLVEFNYPFSKNAMILLEKDLKKKKILKYFTYVHSKLTTVKKRYLKKNFKVVKKINYIYPCNILVKQL